MSFSDIFSSKFLENYTGISGFDMILGLFLSLCIGVFIFFVYKKTFSGVLYSASFGLSLVLMCMISTFIIMAVTSNVVLSLGMVGALSIVRFRTAIKDPLDIVFMFWSLAAGIVLAAGFVMFAMFGSLFIGIVILIFANRKIKESPYILVVSLDNMDKEKEIMSYVESQTKRSIVKSKTVSKTSAELTIEVLLKEGESQFVNDIAKIEGVNNAVMVSFNGDFM